MTEFIRAIKAEAYKHRKTYETVITLLSAAALAGVLGGMMVYGLT